jgi:hypothetical protein
VSALEEMARRTEISAAAHAAYAEALRKYAAEVRKFIEQSKGTKPGRKKRKR